MSLASPCFDPGPESDPARTLRLMALPLEDKITWSKVLIQRFYIAMKGRVYVSYSGGKDSTVLLHLVRSMYPDVPAVFIDTGLEFPELRRHVRETDNVTVLRPERSFRDVILTEGYPLVSKECAHALRSARRGNGGGDCPHDGSEQ